MSLYVIVNGIYRMKGMRKFEFFEATPESFFSPFKTLFGLALNFSLSSKLR